MEIKLKFSKLKLTINLKEVVKNIFDFNIGTVLTETLRIENTNEQKAFLLLLKTIQKTNVELAKKYGQQELNKEADLVLKASLLESNIVSFLEREVVIKREFFEDIIQFNPNYLRESYLFFKEYLDLLNIKYPNDLNFIYFNDFRINLEDEFQENREIYKSLIEYFDNPIFNENKKMLKQLDYYKKLIKSFVEPLQSDIPECKETLKDLYVEPFFEIHKNSFTSKTAESISEFNGLEKEISTHLFLKDYYFKNKKHPNFTNSYNLLFVLGQPGQGKTSFCSKLVYDYIVESDGIPKIPLFFVKIRDLVARDFIDTPFNEIQRQINQNFDFQNNECILVLDGLDEAYMSGGLNDGDLRNLYERLKSTTQSNEDLKIILTSRFNYLKLNDSCIDRSSVIQLSTLNSSQIKEYSEKFKQFYPENKLVEKIDKILTDKKYEHILELLQQAVLLYFIAISDIDIEEQDSRTVVYDKIFNSLAMRSWDKNGQLSYIKQTLKDNPFRYEKLLRDYIRNIAFAIYQSPKLYITINQLLELDATTEFINKCFDDSINYSQEKIKEISKYLLISFYFQESKSNDSSDTAIEFFHNSLWEYLTAEYMWEENKKLLLDKDSYGDYKTVNREKYFNLLDRLIGQKKLGDATLENLTNIIINASESEKKEIALLSKPLFDKLLQDDFLLEYSIRDNRLSSIEKSIAIFELFWVFYYRSSLATTNIIIGDDNLIKYLFDYSYSFRINGSLKNMKFVGDMISTSFAASFDYENIEFNSEIDNSWFARCNFKDLKFTAGFGLCVFSGCNFDGVVIEECSMYKYSNFAENKFENCRFENVYVENINWLKDLNKKNTLTQAMLTNHKVEKTFEVNRISGKREVKYIVRYIGEDVKINE
ncbi:AAA family ATPase [Flavobacterium limnophilum]|uniref:nSTAND3 domain-containing NTPase n=1 Tax=Flavobacterium limnophilum TaxID=3003262 RepID=UPI0024823821|nr:pentapeptide repeat-containing protein [Flavobacterium limnophilum]